ncbi:MAG: tetratricopeptide repeat protein [Thermoleophilia bacterium]
MATPLAGLALGLIGLFVVYVVEKPPDHPPGVVQVIDGTDEGSEGAGGPAGSGGSETGSRPDTPAATSPPEHASEEEWGALLPRLEEAARAAPDNATAQRRLAIALHNLGRLDEARSIYETLLAAGEDAIVRNRLGNVLRDQGDLKGAEEAYRRALADDPTLPGPYVNLAELLSRSRRTEEALRLLAEGGLRVAPAAKPALDRAASALEAPGDSP